MHKQKNEQTIIDFPAKTLTFSVVLTILGILYLSFFVQKSYKFLEQFINLEMEILKASEKIIYYDEVLTMSARLAANNAQDIAFWYDRYKRNETLLDQEISKVIRIGEELNYDTLSISQTNYANQELIKIERQAFDLSKKGNHKEARNILFGSDYSKYKKEYSDSILKVVDNMRSEVKSLLYQTQKNVFYTRISTMIGGLFLFLIWIYTLVNIHRWHYSAKYAFIEACLNGKKFEESVEKLKLKNHELERFNYIVAHDLKESLRSIFSFSQLLENELDDTSKVGEYLKNIQNSCLSMKNLIDDLLSYAKTSELTISKISLNDLLDKMQKETLAKIIKQNHVTIIYTLLPTIETDITKINQVFYNLIINAIIYNDSKKPKINVSAHKTKDYLEVYVSDNGIGIEKEYSDSIFELFTRLNDKRVYKGTGLGLAICKKTMKSLGGDVYLKNSSKNGSVFVIEIPI